MNLEKAIIQAQSSACIPDLLTCAALTYATASGNHVGIYGAIVPLAMFTLEQIASNLIPKPNNPPFYDGLKERALRMGVAAITGTAIGVFSNYL